MKSEVLKLIIGFFVLCPIGLGSCELRDCVESECTDVCTMYYDPVCGCNNKIYGNSCVAECHGINEYTEGACP